jgi:hypothetical protein
MAFSGNAFGMITPLSPLAAQAFPLHDGLVEIVEPLMGLIVPYGVETERRFPDDDDNDDDDDDLMNGSMLPGFIFRYETPPRAEQGEFESMASEVERDSDRMASQETIFTSNAAPSNLEFKSYWEQASGMSLFKRSS